MDAHPNPAPTLIFVLELVALPARTYAVELTAQAPEPAAAVGFNMRTFGPNVTIGQNWHKFDFFGVSPSKINAVQNPDGSVTISPGGDNYGALLSTAARGPDTGFAGVAFGGGGYFQATMKFKGPASFWADDIENMNGLSAGIGPHQWPGQPYGYGNWIEVRFRGVRFSERLRVRDPQLVWPSWQRRRHQHPGVRIASLSTRRRLHETQHLWVPMGAGHGSRQGYAKFFFNGVQVGNTITWNQYNPSAGPPPSTSNGTAYSVLDKLHLALILGTGTTTSNTVYDVEVWQASAADDIFSLPSRTATPAPISPRR